MSQGRLLALPNSTFFFYEFSEQQLDEPDVTHPVVSELTARGVDGSLGTVGGFEVEVVVDVHRVETRLKEREVGGELRGGGKTRAVFSDKTHSLHILG